MDLSQKLRNIFQFASSSQVSFFIFLEVICGIISGLASFILFIDIAEDVLKKEGIFIDTAIAQFVYSFRNPVLTTIMRFISFLGAEFIIFATVFITLFFLCNKHKREATLFFFMISMGFVLNTVIKYLLKIPRPDIDPLYIEKFYGFPSGHAMNSFIFYASLSYFMFHFTHNKKLSVALSCVSGILIILIGFSRIYLGVHYPSDVIAGFIVGFWWLVTTIVMDKTIIFYNLYRNRKKVKKFK